MNYEQFIASKQTKLQKSGFTPENLNSHLFPFQKHCVTKALEAGRYAIFSDCGTGKTIMQLEWAHQVAIHTQKPVLILCPLAVSGQTIQEGAKFGIQVERWSKGNEAQATLNHLAMIMIANYEKLENISTEIFSGVVLDESSILKNFTGKYKNLIIDKFIKTPYKLACTATPAPNDLNEIGNHSEFLNIMEAPDMRMRWFVRDEGMNNYRLKGHAEIDFFGWIGGWSSVLRTPKDIGFESEGYELPPLNMQEFEIETEKSNNGKLFNDVSVNATNFNQELRRSKVERLNKAAELANNSDENFIIWVKQNEEADYLKKLIPDAIEVRGNDKPEVKEKYLLGFANNEFRVLITKAKIAQFGLNYQNCHNQIFASLDFSFEGLYQAVRRSYRFGQKHQVNIFLITTDTMQNVIGTIKEKQNQFDNLMEKTVKHANAKEIKLKSDYDRIEVKTDDYQLVQGDCVELIRDVESDSIDFSVFSPPFSTLFTYSDNIRDMGNCESNEQFFEQTEYLLKELYRIIRPGRLVAVHTKDLAKYKGSSGFTGLHDFTGEYHQAMEDAGFKYHSKITIWTDPVLEMQRTKTQRLLYKQLRTDSSYTGIGLPEYVTIFRKWEGSEEDWTPVKSLNADNFPLDTWQKWASPVWMDIRRTDVLNDWRGAKDHKDEKHICPLQLGVIERCIALWSNERDTVFTPFMGIGSEVYQAVKMNRKGLGFELKESYFQAAKKNLQNVIAEKSQMTLFE